MKKDTQSLHHVGLPAEADPFSAALWSFTAKMDTRLHEAEKGKLKEAFVSQTLAQRIKANSLNPSIRTR